MKTAVSDGRCHRYVLGSRAGGQRDERLFGAPTAKLKDHPMVQGGRGASSGAKICERPGVTERIRSWHETPCGTRNKLWPSGLVRVGGARFRGQVATNSAPTVVVKGRSGRGVAPCRRSSSQLGPHRTTVTYVVSQGVDLATVVHSRSAVLTRLC